MEYILSVSYYLSLICILHNFQNNSYEAGTIILIFQVRLKAYRVEDAAQGRVGSKRQSQDLNQMCLIPQLML